MTEPLSVSMREAFPEADIVPAGGVTSPDGRGEPVRQIRYTSADGSKRISVQAWPYDRHAHEGWVPCTKDGRIAPRGEEFEDSYGYVVVGLDDAVARPKRAEEVAQVIPRHSVESAVVLQHLGEDGRVVRQEIADDLVTSVGEATTRGGALDLVESVLQRFADEEVVYDRFDWDGALSDGAAEPPSAGSATQGSEVNLDQFHAEMAVSASLPPSEHFPYDGDFEAVREAQRAREGLFFEAMESAGGRLVGDRALDSGVFVVGVTNRDGAEAFGLRWVSPYGAVLGLTGSRQYDEEEAAWRAAFWADARIAQVQMVRSSVRGTGRMHHYQGTATRIVGRSGHGLLTIHWSPEEEPHPDGLSDAALRSMRDEAVREGERSRRIRTGEDVAIYRIWPQVADKK